MEHKRILELALEALQEGKKRVEAEIEAIGAEMRGIVRDTLKRKAARTTSLSGSQRVRTLAERKAQSKRMKAYWAAKRSAAAAKAKRSTPSSTKGRAKSVSEGNIESKNKGVRVGRGFGQAGPWRRPRMSRCSAGFFSGSASKHGSGMTGVSGPMAGIAHGASFAQLPGVHRGC